MESATGECLATLAGHERGVISALFSPDGSGIVTALDKTSRIWTILPTTAGPPPAWFADFLRYLAQMRLNSDGELEALKLAGWLALQERLRTIKRASAGAGHTLPPHPPPLCAGVGAQRVVEGIFRSPNR